MPSRAGLSLCARARCRHQPATTPPEHVCSTESRPQLPRSAGSLVQLFAPYFLLAKPASLMYDTTVSSGLFVRQILRKTDAITSSLARSHAPATAAARLFPGKSVAATARDRRCRAQE